MKITEIISSPKFISGVAISYLVAGKTISYIYKNCIESLQNIPIENKELMQQLQNKICKPIAVLKTEMFIVTLGFIAFGFYSASS